MTATKDDLCAATQERSVSVRQLRFPPGCVSCGAQPQTIVAVSGSSQREWKALGAILAVGAMAMSGYSMTYHAPIYAVLGMLSILAELAFCYLLFYWVLLVPALALFRYCRRKHRIELTILGVLPAAFLWLCM